MSAIAAIHFRPKQAFEIRSERRLQEILNYRTRPGRDGQGVRASRFSKAGFDRIAVDHEIIRSMSRDLEPAEINQLVGLFNAGHYVELESRARVLVEQHPDSGHSWKVLGACLKIQGKDGLLAIRRAAALLPGDAEAHHNLGIALKDLGQLDGALVTYRRALEIIPNYAGAHNDLGGALRKLGQLDNAVVSYRRALEVKPDYAEAHNNLGVALTELGQLADALASFHSALEIMPDLVEAHNNLGFALKDLGQLADALASFHRALAIKPDYTDAYSNLLFAQNYLAELPEATLLAEAKCFGNLAARKARPYADWPNTPESGRCLRVGLVSGDLRNHPAGLVVEGLLAALSPKSADRLKIIAYPSYICEGAVTERIKVNCHGWHSAMRLSDEVLARLIRKDGIDILIDLSGHTAHNRLPMFAWKPAPVQVSWLGYFATTGITAIDYFIADPWTLPASQESSFTETIWRLPETGSCLTPPDIGGEVAPLPANKNGYVTFGSFNRLDKMNDAVVALWARALRAVPNSRLLLNAKELADDSMRLTTQERFAGQGITAERLILQDWRRSRKAHLETYDRVDIALDSFPYPGSTTSVEGLWMGVPVLTLRGERFLSRLGVGILMNAGLPDWITVDPDDYVRRAVSHAGNLESLAMLRKVLRQKVLASPLFDTQRFAHNFEAALRDMWTQWCNQHQSKSL